MDFEINKNQIIKLLKKHKEEMRLKFGVTKIGLFGSYARGDQGPDSDIDLAVEIEAENSFDAFYDLKKFLEELLRHRIDLGFEESLKSVVKDSIFSELF